MWMCQYCIKVMSSRLSLPSEVSRLWANAALEQVLLGLFSGNDDMQIEAFTLRFSHPDFSHPDQWNLKTKFGVNNEKTDELQNKLTDSPENGCIKKTRPNIVLANMLSPYSFCHMTKVYYSLLTLVGLQQLLRKNALHLLTRCWTVLLCVVC